MKNRLFSFYILLSSFIACSNAYALDPVAPKEERKFGTVEVKSPNPDDVCLLIPAKTDPSTEVEHSTKCKPGETIKVPVGDYHLKVTVQDYSFNKDVSVQPTERSYIVVTGFGNLKIISSNPGKEKVTVTNQKGEVVKTSVSGKNISLPIGTYKVLVKIGSSEVKQDNVKIITNTTREIEIGN